jgi:lipoprotein-releasing system ATP-binding protein
MTETIQPEAVGATPTPVLEARGLVKSYRGGDGGLISVLDGVDLTVSRGEMVAIVGESGAGKSTLLHVLGVLDRPDHGAILLDGERATEPPSTVSRSRWRLGRALARRRHLRAQARVDERMAAVRNRKVGFVFQFHHLLREFTALENVMMPLRIGGAEEGTARDRAEGLLRRVGLGGRMHHRPSELSGGEQQRTAVARALAVGPALLLADEPSGNLDHLNSERLHDLFAELARDVDIGMVVVTHNRSLAARADRVLLLDEGRLVEHLVGEEIA